MICNSCMDGGNANKIGLIDVAIEKHKQCNFKGCCCQHKTKTLITEQESHSSE